MSRAATSIADKLTQDNALITTADKANSTVLMYMTDYNEKEAGTKTWKNINIP